MPPVPVPRHVDGRVLRRYSKDQGNRCSNVYMYIELQEARVSPTGNWIVHLLSQCKNVVYDAFVFGFVLFCSVLFVLFCLLSFFFFALVVFYSGFIFFGGGRGGFSSCASDES